LNKSSSFFTSSVNGIDRIQTVEGSGDDSQVLYHTQVVFINIDQTTVDAARISESHQAGHDQYDKNCSETDKKFERNFQIMKPLHLNAPS
jgi:hypothetical protein